MVALKNFLILTLIRVGQGCNCGRLWRSFSGHEIGVDNILIALLLLVMVVDFGYCRQDRCKEKALCQGVRLDGEPGLYRIYIYHALHGFLRWSGGL